MERLQDARGIVRDSVNWAFDCAQIYYEHHEDKLALKTSQAKADFILCHANMLSSMLMTVYEHESEAPERDWE